LVSTVLVLAALSGIAAIVYANGSANRTGLWITDTDGTTNATWCYGGPFGMPGCFGRMGHGFGRGNFVTVSEEYKNNAISIAENDSDVQNLLNQGYNITNVRPIINATVEANGTVTMKATTAVVTLEKDATGRAAVWVDIEQAKVTRIEILSITIIDKS
jgi:hypothetical protein